MLDKVLKGITEYDMLRQSHRVTVALSGGADSVSLLNALIQLKEELNIEIYAAHLNHCLRGDESDRDEAFVRALCEKMNITLFCEKADINTESAKSGESTELCARRVRYQFLERVAAGGVIATAHTASDSAETVLLNLTRGTALKGLCGIPAVRGIFIRPLILVTRAEVEQYCEKNKISYVTDSTNLTDDYTRNKIRHNVVPTLCEINTSFENTVTRTAKILSEDNSFLEQAAARLYSESEKENGLKTERLLAAHPAISKRVIMRYLSENGVDAFSANLEQVLGILQGGKVVLPAKKTLSVKKGVLKLEKEEEAAEFQVEYSVINREIYENLKKVNTLLLKNTLDYDKISGEVLLRGRISGDKIRLSGRGVTKTLKKLYTENAVPQGQRENLPLLADNLGPVWVHGFGVAERVEVDCKTKNILLVKSEIIGG